MPRQHVLRPNTLQLHNASRKPLRLVHLVVVLEHFRVSHRVAPAPPLRSNPRQPPIRSRNGVRRIVRFWFPHPTQEKLKKTVCFIFSSLAILLTARKPPTASFPSKFPKF